MIAQLILRAATEGTACGNCVVRVHCDNKGVLCHSLNKDMRLKENQAQADGIWCMKKLMRGNAVSTENVWVKAHVKTSKGCQKTMEQKHNHIVDAIAKASVGEGLRTGNYATSEMPLEDVWFSVNGKKVAGNTGQISNMRPRK